LKKCGKFIIHLYFVKNSSKIRRVTNVKGINT
jgi:hypothetical protein